ncbi:MAG TPA: methyltransferase domain-containing protein [Methanosarcinales archaeon]|nr:methyltransferase domain-containing protein [Methanosarcinales archaeon]
MTKLAEIDIELLTKQWKYWKSVIKALDKTIPRYDLVNFAISIGKDNKLRQMGISALNLQEGMVVLDAGTGPGNIASSIFKKSNVHVIGLDPLTSMLGTAKNKNKNKNYSLIQGVFEYLPLADNSVNGIICSYSFRDAINKNKSLSEFSRVLKDNGKLVIVDLGKPDFMIFQKLISLYILYIIPIIAKILISSKLDGNPWKALYITYKMNWTNKELKKELSKIFTNIHLKTILFGGGIVAVAKRRPSRFKLATKARRVGEPKASR